MAKPNAFTAAALTSELRPDVPVFARVLLLVVRLELPERLEILQAQRAQEALAHFGRVPEGRRAARRHRGRAYCPHWLPGCGGRIVLRHCLKRTRPAPCNRRRKKGAGTARTGREPLPGPAPRLRSRALRGPAVSPRSPAQGRRAAAHLPRGRGHSCGRAGSGAGLKAHRPPGGSRSRLPRPPEGPWPSNSPGAAR